VATAATTVAMRLQGVALFRVHNVAVNRDALAVADAIVATRGQCDRLPRTCRETA
jgi:dihydropteroate synthase